MTFLISTLWYAPLIFKLAILTIAKCKVELLKVDDIGLQRYRDSKIREREE